MSLSSVRRRLAATILLGLAILGCASRPVLQSTEVLTRGAVLRLHRIVVLAPLADAEKRRRVEDAFVGALGDPRFQAFHAVIPAGDMDDALAIKRRFADEGYDGTLVLQVLEKSELSQGPGSWGLESTPGAGDARFIPGALGLRESILVRLELFSLAQDRLAWKGASRISTPSQLLRLVAKAAPETVRDLEARGLLASPPQ